MQLILQNCLFLVSKQTQNSDFTSKKILQNIYKILSVYLAFCKHFFQNKHKEVEAFLSEIQNT